MNAFAIRYVKEDSRYRGEYRLAHWSGFRTVLDSSEETMLFAHPSDAYQAATVEFLKLLNGDCRYWAGRTSDEAKERAERLFKGTGNGESKTQTEAGA